MSKESKSTNTHKSDPSKVPTIDRKGSQSAEEAKKVEEALMAKVRNGDKITVDDINSLTTITSDFLTPAGQNLYDIEFTHFKVRDVVTDTVIFEVKKPGDNVEYDDEDESGNEDESEKEDDNEINLSELEQFLTSPKSRFVRYQFSRKFLKLKDIGAYIEFKVGDEPIKNFEMIEKHYFKGKLLKSFQFAFGFCMRNSTNTIEHIYQVPKLTDKEIDEIVKAPYETRSDSFYFVDKVLVMHNKAEYAYEDVPLQQMH
uniref:GMP_PDE_delta domain-containing protein n=1 Tax=Rhabditophanes sp. KR3021 TaxID=114890 RepID=A0AC35TMR9_9BILA